MSARPQSSLPAALDGFYAITPNWDDTARLMDACQRVLARGVSVMQYRNKQASPALRRAQAQALHTLTRAAGIPLVINDHLELALEIGAEGLHLGGEDGDLAAARRALGPAVWLGASCYDQLELAREALRQGADYVAFGAAYPSATKPHAVHAPLSLYAEACASLRCPVVAVGGITQQNAAPLFAVGVRYVAAIHALFSAAPLPG